MSQYYFTGKPCKFGHISERYKCNSNCVACMRLYLKGVRKKHPERWAEYRAKNRRKIADKQAVYYKKNKDRITKEHVAYCRQRRKTDPVFNTSYRLRSRMHHAYSGRLKPARTEELIGCTYSEFCANIESLFVDGMSWDNRKMWHIDHIIPISAFDLDDIEQAKSAFHWSNCQPLWQKDNILKKNKMPWEMLK